MKKIIAAVVALALAAVSMPVQAEVEYSKTCQKEAAKFGKKQAKEVKKAGWTYAGTIPLESAFEKYNLKSGDCGAYEAKTATVNNVKYVATGEKSCYKQVCNLIVMEANNEINGVSTDEDTMVGDSGDRLEINKVASKYTGKLNGVVETAITLSKKESNGLYTVECFFLVNKERKARFVTTMAKDMESLDERADKILKDTFGE